MKKAKIVLAALLVASTLMSLTACSSTYKPEKIVKLAEDELDATEFEMKKFKKADDGDLKDGIVTYGTGKDLDKLYKDEDGGFGEKLGLTEIDFKNDVKDGTIYAKVNFGEEDGKMSLQYLQCMQMNDKKTAQNAFNDIVDVLADGLDIDPEDYDEIDYLSTDNIHGIAHFMINLDSGDIVSILSDYMMSQAGVDSDPEIYGDAKEQIEETFGKDIRMVIAVYQKGANLTVAFGFASDGKLKGLSTICKEAMDEDPLAYRNSEDLIEDLGKTGNLFQFFN